MSDYIKNVKNKLYNRYYKKNYYFSQTGEDIIVNFWLNKENGYYVDIGSNHPTLLNNTYLFYLNGWTGINVEPNPSAYQNIMKKRPKDLNLNIGIDLSVNKQRLYIFEPTTMSTFSSIQAKEYQKLGYRLIEKKSIECMPLKELFKRNKPKTLDIDLLNIDVEGMEESVINSNDWNIYRPKMVILETVKHSPIVKTTYKYNKLMKQLGYVAFADTFINTIYMSEEVLKEKRIQL